MTEQLSPQQELQELIASISDEQLLRQCMQSLRKAVATEGNDWETLAEQANIIKQQKSELEKAYEIVSFQLGSPLNTLQTLSDMLMKGAEGMSKAQLMEFNAHLHTQIGKVQHLLGNLIQWADLEVRNYSFKPAQIDAKELATAVFEQYEAQALQKRQQYELAAAGDLQVWADAAMLRRTLSNLLSNAIKFTPENGKITLTATKQGNGVTFSIADTGIGMGSSKMKNIFNPGRKSTQRGTANEPGLGMGLIVAQALVKLHGAELHLDSERGKGTMLSFQLSASEKQN